MTENNPTSAHSVHTAVPESSKEGNASAAAVSLAYLAAAPLVIAAVLVASKTNDSALLLTFMGIYGAALIVFFGGVRWGVAVMAGNGPSFRSLIGAVLPLVVALPLFALQNPIVQFPAIMTIVGVVLVDDLIATRRGSGAPAWYLGVRLPLTALIEVSFLVALVSFGA